MIYLSSSAHCQLLGLVLGILAWILVMMTTGLNEWRLWSVEDDSVITSGEAWVGIWKACFFSHILPSLENCQSISISDSFAPVEIPVAQVLMVLAMISGLAGNISGGMAMRLAYFSVEDRRNIKMLFRLGGILYLLTAVLCLVPLVWNMTSVYNNHTIDFPPEFHLPAAPIRQKVGSAIGVGLFASIMLLISGILFLCYRYAWKSLSSEASRPDRDVTAKGSQVQNRGSLGQDNPAFQAEEALG